MLLSEENERLRSELERMKRLAATLLTTPSASGRERTIQLGSSDAGVKPFIPLSSANTSSFQLSLAQPTSGVTGSFDKSALQSDLSSFNSFKDILVPEAPRPSALPSHGLSRTTSLGESGRFAHTLQLGRQGSLGKDGGSFGTGSIDMPVSTGRFFPFALEDIKHFTGNYGVKPADQKASPDILALLSSKREATSPKKEDTFMYPTILNFGKKLADPFISIPPAPFVSTAPQLSVRLGIDLEEPEEEAPSKRSTRKRDRDSGDGHRKMRLSKEQSMQLEEAFKEQSTHSPKHKTALAHRLGLRPRQVEVWFQNRRARTKLKQTEIDCEVLKRCCETLTEENRRLQKEVIALKTQRSKSGGEEGQASVALCLKCKEPIAPSVRSESVQDGLGDFEMVSDKPENDASDPNPAVNSNAFM